MNIGRFKNIDGECSKYVTIKKNSVFSNFCLHSKLLKTGMNRRISLELNPVDLTQVWTGKEKILYLVFIFTSSKQRRKKKFHVVVVHGKEMYQKACYTMQNLSFNFQIQAFWRDSLSRCYRRRPPPSFIDLCKLLGIRSSGGGTELTFFFSWI